MICKPCQRAGNLNVNDLPAWFVEHSHWGCIDYEPAVEVEPGDEDKLAVWEFTGRYKPGYRSCDCQHKTGRCLTSDK